MKSSPQKKSSAKRAKLFPLSPPPHGSLQVNFCKIPSCPACGIYPDESVLRHIGGPAVKRTTDKNYKPTSTANNVPGLMCRHCGTSLNVKSNQGAYEEYQRVKGYILDTQRGCPRPSCGNANAALEDKTAFQRNGRTAAGSQRYRCRACKLTFSPQEPAGNRQQKTSINGDIFKLLCNSMPMRRICITLKIPPRTLYDRIRFIARKCDEFAADREQKLLSGAICLPRISVSVDMQVYVSNWPTTSDKRRVDLYAMGSADNKSGYVLAMTLNFDKSVPAGDAEEELITLGVAKSPAAFRPHARLWLPSEYEGIGKGASASPHSRLPTKPTADEVPVRYSDTGHRLEMENPEVLDTNEFQLPAHGARTKTDYMAIGHMLFLAEMLKHVGRVTLYLDQDSVFYAAAYAAFLDRFKSGSADAYYVTVKKGATTPERNRAYAASRRAIKKEMDNGAPTELVAALNLISEQMGKLESIGPFKDKWLTHPLPNHADTDKKVCHVTPFPGRSNRRLASQYLGATLHGIDRFFNNVRRSLSPMERSIHSAATDGRTWNGKSNYNPEYTDLLLKIFRTYYNYCHVPLETKDGKTPAQRLGLARAPLEPHDILYFDSERGRTRS